MSDHSAAHTELVQAILLEYSCVEGLTIWKEHTGGAYVNGGFMLFGHPGRSDIIGFKAPNARFVAIEVKTGKRSRLTTDQKTFKRLVESHGGIFIEARSIEQVGKELGLH